MSGDHVILASVSTLHTVDTDSRDDTARAKVAAHVIYMQPGAADALDRLAEATFGDLSDDDQELLRKTARSYQEICELLGLSGGGVINRCRFCGAEIPQRVARDAMVPSGKPRRYCNGACASRHHAAIQQGAV